MRKVLGAILALVALVGLLYIFLLDGFVRGEPRELYIGNEIREALKERDFEFWLMKETEDFHIGDEFVFWVLVGYDPKKYEIDKEGLDYLILDPFEIRSLETYSQAVEGKELFAVKATLQCVICAPGMTHEIEGFKINYKDLEAGTTKKIELDLTIDQPFLFDTSIFGIRGPKYEPVFINGKTSKVLISGGVIVMILGMGVIFSRVYSLANRREKIKTPLSDIDLFRENLLELREKLIRLEDQDPTIKELVHQAYLDFAGLIWRLQGVDIMVSGTTVGLSDELIETIQKCEQAYMRKDLAKEEAISILNELSLMALKL